jgi:DNA-binding SARP family transcriptional activator
MLEADPLDEGAHRRVMAGYASLGRRSRALEQYLRCRRVLVDALGIEPARETAALHARILAGEESVLAA